MDVASDSFRSTAEPVASHFRMLDNYVAPSNKFLRTPNNEAAPKKETAKSTYPMDHLSCSTVLVANKSLKEAHVAQKYCKKEHIYWI